MVQKGKEEVCQTAFKLEEYRWLLAKYQKVIKVPTDHKV